MYFDSTVKIPDEKGKIIRKKKGNTTYVLYQYGRVYNAEKKYAVPQRTIIGKVNQDSPDTMYPNERFQEFFPTVALLEELPEVIIPVLSEPPVRTLRATIPGNESQLNFLILGN